MNFKFSDFSPLSAGLQELVLNSPAQCSRRPSGSANSGDGSDSKDSGFESPFPQGTAAAVVTDAVFAAPQQPSTCDKTSRRCLFGMDGLATPPSQGKRSRHANNDDEDSASKRHRPLRHGQMFLSPQLGKENKLQYNPLVERVKKAVDRLDDRHDLIGDGSQTHVLPTVADVKQQDLKCISPSTVCALLDGDFKNVITSFRIIDCRYPYEYEGGHIKGAENLYTECDIDQLVKQYQHPGPGRHILILHCEFSSNRAPKMLRYLRSLDRKMNTDCYPFLYYPEVYLLAGGYKNFFSNAGQTHCEPQSYKPMHHEAHAADLRHFRVKSKSWTAGENRPGRVRRSLLADNPSFM